MDLADLRVVVEHTHTAPDGSLPLSPELSPGSQQEKPLPASSSVQSREPESPVCVARGRGLDTSEVAFGILTSDRFVATRLLSQQQTWLKQVRDVVFYSESYIATLPTVGLSPPLGEELVGSGAWKNFPALMDLYRRFPSHKWVYFSDDDTFVYVRNLLSRLGHYDHDKDFYLGLYWTPRVDMEWKEVHIAYASGGAGYALSRALLSRMSTTMRTCHKNYRRWAGDVRVGKCVLDLGVQITPEVGFHHEPHDKYTWDMSGGGFPYLHLSNRASAGITAPVSFHHLTVDQMHMYYRMQMADERGPRGELFRYDFAPQLFKEFMAFSPTLGYSFRVLFGVSVEVAHADHRASPPQWRRDFGDPLYLRRAVDPNGGAQQPLRFHMVIAKVPEIFHGDGCSAVVDDPFRLPLRKAAVIAVQCAPCKRLDAPADEPPGYNRICDAWKEDECTLKILLSLSCPARQVVHAPALDVGSTRNGHDLVFRGQATACAEPSRLLRPYEHADPSRPAVKRRRSSRKASTWEFNSSVAFGGRGRSCS
eukprot:6197657-Pleurochrysis_carterae.AAC.7